MGLWRVPARPTFFGLREGVGIVFGIALASIMLTELATYGLIVVVIWCFASATALEGMVVLGVFGAIRTLPIVAEAWRSATIGSRPMHRFFWTRMAPALRPLEASGLVLLALLQVRVVPL